jgi:NTE family protein
MLTMSSPAPQFTGSALALSGGGFRSTLFQVGALWRMNELGLLSKLSCVSAVSGGSIAAGQLGLAWHALSFDEKTGIGSVEAFKKGVVEPLMAFCSKRIDTSAAVDALINPFKSGAQKLRESLQKHLFGNKTLTDLPRNEDGAPRFVFNATNLQTGVRFWMSREDLGDYQIGYTTATGNVPIAVAVAASAAFPPIFAPMEFKLPPGPYTACKDPIKHHPMGQHVSDPAYHHTAQLCDGGTYDNLGLQSIWNLGYDTLWVSDASSAFISYTNYLKQAHWYQPDMLVTLLRVIDTMMRAGEARHRSDLIDQLKGRHIKGAYWGTNTSLLGPEPKDTLPLDPSKIEKLTELPTVLHDFGESVRQQLVNWGYAIADRQIRSGWKGALPSEAVATWPYPQQAL